MESIKRSIERDIGLTISRYLFRQILKRDMRLKWKRVSHQGEYVNNLLEACEKKLFSIEILQYLKSSRVIISFDESIIGGTTSLSYS